MTTTITHPRGTTLDKTMPLSGAASAYTSYHMTIRSRIPASTVEDDDDSDVVATASSLDDDEQDGELIPTGSELRMVFAAEVSKTWPRTRLYAEVKGKGFDGDPDFVGIVDSFELMVTADYVRSVPETPAP